MFTFFRRPNKIHVDCFTYMPTLSQLYPPVLATEKVPTWWKSLTTTVKSPTGPMRSTMKTCPGVSDLFRTGIILQAWHDLYLDWSDQVTLPTGVYWEPQDVGEVHSPSQWGNNSLFKDYVHFKFLSPWRFVEKTGVRWLFINPYWHDPNIKYHVPPGMLEYKYQHATNVNMFLPKNSFPKNLTIPVGTPLAHIIPMSDKDVVIHTHEISEDEYIKKYMGIPVSFTAQYYKKKKILESK